MAVSLDDTPPSQGPMCPVCFRDYSDSETNLIPRILQCGHTYCTECLERLLSMEPEEDEYEQIVLHIRQTGTGWATARRYPLRISPQRPSNELKCPTCNGINRIHNRDVTSLTKNFALLSYRSQNDSSRVKRKVQHYCEEHDHDKRVYCNDCKTLVCAYCQLYGEHKEHNCTKATEVGKAAVDSLLSAKASVLADLDEVTKAEEQVTAAISQLERKERQTERKVKKHFTSLTNQLEERKGYLLTQLKRWSSEQLFILQAQLDSLQAAKKDCEMMLSGCRQLTEGDPLDALAQQEDTIQEIDSLSSRVSGLSFQPLITPSIRCRCSGNMGDLMSSLTESCQVAYDAVRQRNEGGDGASDHDDSTSSSEEGRSTKNSAPGNGRVSPVLSSAADLVVSNEASGHAVQDTQDPATTTLDFASGLPKLDSATYSGAANNCYGASPRTAQQLQRFPWPLGRHSRLHNPPRAEDTEAAFRPAQSTNTENTLYLNPIAPKPKLTNLYSSVQPPPLPRPFLSSDSEDEYHHPHLSRALPLRLRPRTTPLSATLDNLDDPLFIPLSRVGERYGNLEDEEGSRSTMAGTISAGMSAAFIDSDSISSVHSEPPSSGDEDGDSSLHHPQLSESHEDELVIPPSRQYSWTTDTSNGRSLMLEIDHNGTSVQLSIQAQAAEGGEDDLRNLDMDLEEAEDNDLDP